MKTTSNSQYHTALAEIETLIEKSFRNLTQKETGKLEHLIPERSPGNNNLSG